MAYILLHGRNKKYILLQGRNKKSLHRKGVCVLKSVFVEPTETAKKKKTVPT